MTLNGVVALILFSHRIRQDFQAYFMTVVEDRPIMSVEYRLPVPVFHFWPKLLTHHAAQYLCDS